MDLYVLNRNFETIGILDTFHSLVWAERYNQAGDFELVLPADALYLDYVKFGSYLWRKDSEWVMQIDTDAIATNLDDGNTITLTGPSLEKLLSQRIIWGQTILTGSFENGIKTLLNQNAISPNNIKRKIPNLSFRESQDEKIQKATINAQLFGENLYDQVMKMCQEKDFGFRVKFIEPDQMEFYLYTGTDRSYTNEKLPYVVFSPDFDNLINSNYIHSITNFKTVALVAGEGEGAERKTASAADTDDEGSGLDRREMFVEAQDVSSNVPDGYELTEESYLEQLEYQGKLALRETKATTSFEGEIDIQRQFIYQKDFYVGDIVQIANEYGIEGRVRITEIVRSIDETGESVVPTFMMIK